MRHDPIEFAALDHRRARERRRKNRARPTASPTRRFDAAVLPEGAIDEAFANLPQDLPPQPAANAITRVADPKLLRDIAAQVAGLDRQCAQLSRLIQVLDSAPVASC
jgi:hypothetical protein